MERIERNTGRQRKWLQAEQKNPKCHLHIEIDEWKSIWEAGSLYVCYRNLKKACDRVNGENIYMESMSK